jgi:hypothetical protein
LELQAEAKLHGTEPSADVALRHIGDVAVR